MSETILLVAPDTHLRQQVRSALQPHGYRVLEASGGTAARQLCRQQDGPIHLLLTDVLMPEINGHHLAEQITILSPCLRVLYMSDAPNAPLVALFDRTRSLALIQKPFTTNALLRKIRRLLNSLRPECPP